MAYTKSEKPAVAYTAGSNTSSSWATQLYNFLLCEDGTFLLQETGFRINLEWYSSKVVKPTKSYTISDKPVVVWTK